MEKENQKENKGLSISKKSFITAVIIILILMIVAFSMTFFIEGRTYTVDSTTGEYNFTSQGINHLPVWKFFLSPILVLSPSAEGSITIIMIICLLIIIGGVFNSLEKSGILTYMLNKTINKYKNKRYFLLGMISFLFMVLGSGIGMFEEAVPLVPIVVLLCYSLGWDSLTGLGASLLSVCCGFAVGVINPFTVGVAQERGGLPIFSGIGMRLLTFVIIFAILITYLILYAKKIERNPKKSIVYKEDLLEKEKIGKQAQFVRNKDFDKALIWFLSWMGAMVVFVLLSIPIRVLSDYTMAVIVLFYIFAGIGAVLIGKTKPKVLAKTFGQGIIAILPAIIMILMASSVNYMLIETNVMNSILYFSLETIKNAPAEFAVILIYFVVLLFNFFVPSGSAEALLVMPTIFPIADALHISRQTAILAFAAGDGFSNVLYPTNPVLLITLGLTVVSFTKWLKWSYKIQLIFLAATIGILLFAHNIVYVI